MMESDIYLNAKNKALIKTKRLRDAKELQPFEKDPNTLELDRLKMFHIEDETNSSYSFLMNQVKKVTNEMFVDIIHGLLDKYHRITKPIMLDKSIYKTPIEILFYEQEKSLLVFMSVDDQKYEKIIELSKALVKAEKVIRTLLISEDAYKLRFDHNDDESDPTRGTGLYSIHDFFNLYFNEEEYVLFKKVEADYTEEVQKYLGFKTSKILTPNSLYSFKRLITYYFHKDESYDKVTPKINPIQLKEIKKRFLDEGYYKAMIGKPVLFDFTDSTGDNEYKVQLNFAQSFITAEWLYDTIKNSGGIDYTPVAIDYLKAVEQLLYAIVLIHVNEERTIKYKYSEEYVELTDSNIRSETIDTSMGSLISFLQFEPNRKKPNRDLFSWQINVDTQNAIIQYLRDVKELRNGYVHKDNLIDWSTVENIGTIESIRAKVYTACLLILGSFEFSSSERVLFSIPELKQTDDYELLCEYMNFNAGQLFYISKDDGNLVPGFAVQDAGLVFNDYGEPQFSGVYFKELIGVGSGQVIISKYDFNKTHTSEEQKFEKDSLPLRIYCGEMRPCAEGMMFSGPKDIIYNNGEYTIPSQRTKPGY